MKKTRFAAITALMSLVAFSSCKKIEEVPPVLEVGECQVVETKGGVVSVDFKVTNLPAADPEAKELSVKAADAWVHDFVTDAGKVSFTVDPNDSKVGSPNRETELTFSYPKANNVIVKVQQKAESKLGIKIEITKLTPSQVDFKCTPDDLQRTYVVRMMQKDEFDALGGDDKVIAADMEFFLRPDWNGTPGTLEQHLEKGVLEDFYSLINTKPQYIYAYGINPDGTVTSDIIKTEVTAPQRPVIKFTQPEQLTHKGGQVTVKYVVENPIEGKTIEITQPQVSWIHDITFNDTEITFTVDPNTDKPGSDPRQGSFNVSYPEAYNSPVKVSQASAPELNLDLQIVSLTTSEIKVKCTPSDLNMPYVMRMMSKEDYDRLGSDDALIKKDIEQFTAEDPWAGTANKIENFQKRGVKEDSWSVYDQKPRIVYAYGLEADGTVTSKVFKLNFTAPAKPVIKLTQPEQLTHKGGQVTVKYVVENPIEGKTIEITQPQVSWIHDITFNDTEITFTVDPNTDKPGTAPRQGWFNVSYPEAYSSPVKVSQASAPEFSLDLQIVSLTTSEIKVKCTPSDLNMPYVMRMISKEDYDRLGSDDALIKKDIEQFTAVDPWWGTASKIEDFQKRGVKEDYWSVYDQKPRFVYAYGLEADGTVTTKVFKLDFTAPAKPKINITQPAVVPVEGGKVTVRYTIENPVAGVSIQCTPGYSCSWIHDVTFTDTEITFTVDSNEAEQPGSSPRRGWITVDYPNAYSGTINVIQNAPKAL